MTLIPGSAELRANESRVSSRLSGNISGLGCKLGAIGAGNSICITYRASIAETAATDKTTELTSAAYLTYDSFHSPGITAHDSASVQIARHPSGDYLVGPEVLASLVDSLIATKYKVLPPFSTGELSEMREKAIQELDERIGIAVFGKLTPAQNKEFDALLDQDESTEQDYEDFFDRVGLDTTHIVREAIEDFVNEFFEQADQ